MARAAARYELLLINLWSLVLILIVSLVDAWPARVVLGLPFLLFFPGYVLVASLLPRRSDLEAGERLALSVGLSVIITSGMGLILSVAWEIRLYPILVGLTAFVAVLSVVGWYRRRKVAEEDWPVSILSLLLGDRGPHNVLESILSVLLVLAVVGGGATLAYAVVNPRAGEAFTEFYLLGAEDLPGELAAGEHLTVTMGIVNHEREVMTYTIEPLMGQYSLPPIGPIALGDGEKWEGEVTVVPAQPSARTRLTEPVAVPVGEGAAPVTALKVESALALEAGDRILIGEEVALVQSIEGNTVMLEAGARADHPSGEGVVELQRAEFRLFENRGVGDGGATSLGLWVGKDRLCARVRHEGPDPAGYQIDVRVSGGQGGGPVAVSATGPADQPAGEVWAPELVYPFSEMNEVRLTLHSGDQVLYEASEPAPYPSVYVWLAVT